MKKKILLFAFTVLISISSFAFTVTTSCGETYSVVGCENTEDVEDVVGYLESLC